MRKHWLKQFAMSEIEFKILTQGSWQQHIDNKTKAVEEITGLELKGPGWYLVIVPSFGQRDAIARQLREHMQHKSRDHFTFGEVNILVLTEVQIEKARGLELKAFSAPFGFVDYETHEFIRTRVRG